MNDEHQQRKTAYNEAYSHRSNGLLNMRSNFGERNPEA
jgi:hypothetical protein